jgi:hypothetical protein
VRRAYAKARRPFDNSGRATHGDTVKFAVPAAGARTNIEADVPRVLVSSRMTVELVDECTSRALPTSLRPTLDVGLGSVDAAVVAIAERTNAAKIATQERNSQKLWIGPTR